jgi:hypothetical protein
MDITKKFPGGNAQTVHTELRKIAIDEPDSHKCPVGFGRSDIFRSKGIIRFAVAKFAYPPTIKHSVWQRAKSSR